MNLAMKGKVISLVFLKEKSMIKIGFLSSKKEKVIKEASLVKVIKQLEEKVNALSPKDFPLMVWNTEIEKFSELKNLKNDLLEFYQLLSFYQEKEKKNYIWFNGQRKIKNVKRSKKDEILILSDGDEIHGVIFEKVLIRIDIAEKMMSKAALYWFNKERFENYYVFDICQNDFILVLFADLPEYWSILNQSNQTGENTDQIKERVLERLEKKYHPYVESIGREKIKENLNKIPKYQVQEKALA